MKLYDDLVWRGLVKDVSNPELENILNNESVTFYWGTDPTADSLHIGHYSSLVTAKRLARAGHKPILLIGGATGLIGDPRPSGEREIISKETLDNYLAGTQPEITDVGEILDNVYLKQEVRIKEALISTEENIFTNPEDLSRYMLFGTLEAGKEYEVKKGDDVKTIATNNMLSVNEFLIANPQIVSENALLTVGQKVNISLINPLVDVIEETTKIEKQTIKYETTVEYDNSLSASVRYVKQEGSNGLVKVTYKNEIINGLLNNAVTVSTEEITPTINRILVVGGINTVYVGDSSYWAWPTNKPYRISSYFGPRWGSWHYGIDITGTGHGSPIYAIQNGNVIRTGTRGDMGNHVMITHNNGYNSVYMHLSKILVNPGDTVVKGQIIGLMGSTGRSTGTHLHLGVWTGSSSYSNARMIDPLTIYR